MERTKVWAPHSLHRIPLAGPNRRPDGKRVTTDRAQQVQPLRAQNMREKGEDRTWGARGVHKKILSVECLPHYPVIHSLPWREVCLLTSCNVRALNLPWHKQKVKNRVVVFCGEVTLHAPRNICTGFYSFNKSLFHVYLKRGTDISAGLRHRHTRTHLTFSKLRH